MIRSLRRWHWRWMLILGLTLPLLLIAILGARDFTRHDSPLPEEIRGQQHERSPERP